MPITPPIIKGCRQLHINKHEIQPVYLKNKSINYILTRFKFVEPYLSSLDLHKSQHRYISIDIKIKDHLVEETTCIPGWHCDVTCDPLRAELSEVHHILTCELAPTEFISTPLKLQYTTSLKEQQSLIDQQSYKIFTLEPWTWYTYGRLNFHRGAIVKTSGRRFLVRVTQSDIIKPIDS